MSTPSSSSRVETLIREAVALGADDLYLKGNGEGATIRYRVGGFLVEEAQKKITDFQGLIAEIKSYVTEDVGSDENEWYSQFPLRLDERTVWIQVLWVRERGTEAVAFRILARWLGFDDLGLGPRDAATLDELISYFQGFIVGSGADQSGHATTLNALLERLAQLGKRVVSFNSNEPRLQGVTQIEIEDEGLKEQIELLVGHFDVFALGNLDSAAKARAAFDLAGEGHLVLGLVYNPCLTMALLRFLNFDISPQELRAYFLGGWSQTLIPRADQNGHIGIFACMNREEASHQVFERQWLKERIASDEEANTLWNDAEEKIAQGLVRREDVIKHIRPL